MIILKWRHEDIKIILSEISFSNSGVTLHYRDYPSAINFITPQQSIETRKLMKEVFPDKFVEKYQVIITLGEFIDNIQKIT